MYVCTYRRTRKRTYIRTYTHTYIHISQHAAPIFYSFARLFLAAPSGKKHCFTKTFGRQACNRRALSAPAPVDRPREQKARGRAAFPRCYCAELSWLL